jgi:hypothetical protein
MTRHRTTVLTLLLSGLASVTRGQAPLPQPSPCGVDEASLDDALNVVEGHSVAAWLRTQRSQNPDVAKQVQTPSTASATVSPVDRPSLPGLLALALDGNLVKLGEKPALTTSLSPFAFLALARPDVVDDQRQYERYRLLRRLDGSLSLGGKGESFDRDGDGKADPALDSEDLADSIAWEVRVQVLGSRDQRDPRYARLLPAVVGPPMGDELTAYGDFLAALGDPAQHPDAPTPDADGCWNRKALDEYLAGVEETLVPLGRKTMDTRGRLSDVRRRIDRSLVVTLFSSGVRRKETLGVDRYGFGARAARGLGPFDHTLNAAWSRDEEDLQGLRPTRLKLGYQATASLKARGYEESQVSLFAAWERYSNVPSAAHRTIAKAGGKLELRLAPGLTLPVSITWANHADLLTGADSIIGHIGIGLDLSDRRKAKAAATP